MKGLTTNDIQPSSYESYTIGAEPQTLNYSLWFNLFWKNVLTTVVNLGMQQYTVARQQLTKSGMYISAHAHSHRDTLPFNHVRRPTKTLGFFPPDWDQSSQVH